MPSSDFTGIHPVILSGGAGTRLWPVSRSLYPKQLTQLVGESSLLQQTLARVAPARGFAPPIIICNEAHRFIIAEQLRAAGIAGATLVLEPSGRNTAPAIAVAAHILKARDPAAMMAVLPSDHLIAETEAFLETLALGARAAADNRLVTFGIRPTEPHTGYGYIRIGEPLDAVPGGYSVERFVEKPGRPQAESFLAEGNYVWNSGMFLFSAGHVLEELGRFQPQIVEATARALDAAREDMDFVRLDPAGFNASPSISIDHAVMEKTDHAAVVPAAFGWHDLGSWAAMWQLGPQDAAGNVRTGEVVAVDTAGCYLRSDGPLLAAAGVKDLVVVATDDATLIVPRERCEDVKLLVTRMHEEGRTQSEAHTTVHRPWGSYQGVDQGPRFKVKRITVKPEAQLSLQMHYHRAEHWVVVRGTARVTCGETVRLVHENESTFIPIGTPHRLENPGRIPLELIEVQSGSYLGEDDIRRFDDHYGREAPPNPAGRDPA
ncbi:MAG: mannose-1-phosphate guanylyltransferase/mannose-6-phosphate isomerase [Alphaproteobacteria bacterium]|jgi:mannose-1-phosphate guanylyltransferase/mannose-6-phosphate isomerase|nr:mannose-1-phosphate guanylyltransferase/mannose-6-phosphate isomerase [Alphaproteobacteria bacterium]